MYYYFDVIPFHFNVYRFSFLDENEILKLMSKNIFNSSFNFFKHLKKKVVLFSI